MHLEKIIRTASLETRLNKSDVVYAYADYINFAMIEAEEKRANRRKAQRQREDVVECPCAACRAHRLENYLPQRLAKRHMQISVGKTTRVDFISGDSATVKR